MLVGGLFARWICPGVSGFRPTSLQTPRNSGRRDKSWGLAGLAQQPPWGLKGRPGRAVQHPRQHAVAHLLRVAQGRSRPVERRNRGLPL